MPPARCARGSTLEGCSTGRRRTVGSSGYHRTVPRRPAPILLFTLTLGGCGGAVDEPVTPPAPAPRFVDVTASAGVNFTRFDGRDRLPGDRYPDGRRMFEWTGGGVAAFDFDGDSLPDLFFPQGKPWPVSEPEPPPRGTILRIVSRRGEVEEPAEDSRPGGSGHDGGSPYSDRLFRNRADGTFADVTDAAGLTPGGYGTGVAAGDFDGDGFADLYVAAAGRNRLLRNNGDGTFRDVTDDAGLGRGEGAAVWTASVAVADVTGDGLPDLVDANYLGGRDVFTAVCADEAGVPRTCSPARFPAEPPRIWLNLGTGRFADVSRTADLLPTDGNDAAGGGALGIIVGPLIGGDNVIFFACDQRPNALFVREEGVDSLPRFRDVAAERGVATDRDGVAEAGMGVAAKSSDAVGADLFVTNFSDQSNTLYRRTGTGFVDATRAAGLYRPGFDTLGFGTQFLDLENDGDADLIVANGHLDDFTHRGIPFHMRPLLMGNDATGSDGGERSRWSRPGGDVSGPFFERPALGRAVARLDWDADGADECVVTHLGGPAVLLRNAGPRGPSVSLRLVGTAGDRDAAGARVTIDAGDTRRTAAVFAGDGYMASNERRLTVGSGAVPAGRPVAVAVRWPGGAAERFAGVTAGGRWVLIEGRGAALREPRVFAP